MQDPYIIPRPLVKDIFSLFTVISEACKDIYLLSVHSNVYYIAVKKEWHEKRQSLK